MDRFSVNELSPKKLLHKQLKLHTGFELQDYYKFLYQAALGCEHALSDSDLTFQHLLSEIAELEPVISDPLIEQLSPDGRLIRVNLRPYVLNKGDLELLNSVFFQTANQYKGSLIRLKEFWQEFRTFVSHHIPGFSLVQVDQYWSLMEQDNFPARHHSQAYKKVNKPAYRVVLLELIRDELEEIDQTSIAASFLNT